MARGTVIQGILKKTPYRILAAIACVLTVMAQMAILDYFLIHHKGRWHFFWIAADIIVVVVFIAAFAISIRQLHQSQVEETPKKVPGELPLGYASYGFYAAVLAAKVAVVFWSIAPILDLNHIMGPNMLNIGVALSAVIFFLLIATHHDAEKERKQYIDVLVNQVAFDLLDSAQFLQVLIQVESRVQETVNIHIAIIAFGCLNLFLPTFPLWALSRTQYGNTDYTKMFKASHHFLYLVFVNIPMLVIRSIMWHVYTKDISVFLVKNISSIVVAFWKLGHECYDAEKSEEARDEIEMETLSPDREKSENRPHGNIVHIDLDKNHETDEQEEHQL